MQLFEAAYFDDRLQNATRLVLGLIIRHTAINGICKHFSIYQTAKHKGITRQAIQNQVKKLIKFRYIKEHKAVAGRRTQYKLLFDNLPATQSDCPYKPATQLDCPDAISRNCPDAIQSDCTKKIVENTDNKNKKRALTLKHFIDDLKKELDAHTSQDFGNLSEELLIEEATACWRAWDAKANFPEGNPISAFHGWLRKGIREKKIKPAGTKNDISTNLFQEHIVAKPVQKIQAWHIDAKKYFDDAIMTSWINQLEWDGNGTLYAPTQFIANYATREYLPTIHKILPDVKIIAHPYKEYSNETA